MRCKGLQEPLQVPYTLAENAGLQPVEIVTQLRAAHAAGEKFAGIDVKPLGPKALQTI